MVDAYIFRCLSALYLRSLHICMRMHARRPMISSTASLELFVDVLRDFHVFLSFLFSFAFSFHVLLPPRKDRICVLILHSVPRLFFFLLPSLSLSVFLLVLFFSLSFHSSSHILSLPSFSLSVLCRFLQWIERRCVSPPAYMGTVHLCAGLSYACEFHRCTYSSRQLREKKENLLLFPLCLRRLFLSFFFPPRLRVLSSARAHGFFFFSFHSRYKEARSEVVESRLSFFLFFNRFSVRPRGFFGMFEDIGVYVGTCMHV